MKIANPIGVLGEDLACSYLVKKDYEIIERNFRKKYEEIDIIALSGNTTVFIEVKTRRSGSFGTAAESVSHAKLRHLIQLAQFYKQIHPKLPDDMRIDLIAVTLDSNSNLENLEHIENISEF